ncbi:MAG: hypothetical protein GY781_11365 [Gammaproteobacteria bacterium]|nr:hypothetical protein [Gammaproteobacteria bacterium]
MKFRFLFIHNIKIVSALLLSISIAGCNNNKQDLDINIVVTTNNGELEHYQLTVTRLNKLASNN